MPSLRTNGYVTWSAFSTLPRMSDSNSLWMTLPQSSRLLTRRLSITSRHLRDNWKSGDNMLRWTSLSVRLSSLGLIVSAKGHDSRLTFVAAALVKHIEGIINLYMHEIAMHHNHNIDDFKPPFNIAPSEAGTDEPALITPAHIEALTICQQSIHNAFDS